MSKVAKDNPTTYSGGYNRFRVKRKVCLNGFVVIGGWEEAFVNFCYATSIDIKQTGECFSYMFEGVDRNYYPDFYLPAYDTWVEVKGQTYPKDIAKWDSLINTHHKKLIVLECNEIDDVKKGLFNLSDFIQRCTLQSSLI